MCGKKFSICCVTFLENALNLDIFTHATVPHLKLQVEKNSFGLVSPKTEVVEETMICFIKIQSGNMKMTWNISLFIFCVICKFCKCDGLTVL